MLILERGKHSLCQLLWRPVSSRKLNPRFDRYLHEVAAPALRLTSDGAEHPEEFTNPGHNTIVRRWNTERGVLYARGWRYDLLARPAAAHAHAGRLLAAAGLRVPVMLWVDDSFRTLRKYRLQAAIEAAAPGRPIQELIDARTPQSPPAELRRKVARELRALHAQRGTAWGSPWRPRNELRDPREFWTGRVGVWRQLILRGALLLDAATITGALARMSEKFARLDFGEPRLVHGDLSPANIFCDDALRLTWIDFGTAQYGHPAQDLAYVEQWIDGCEWRDAFLDDYLADEPADLRRDARTDRPQLLAALELFVAAKLWEKIASRIAKRNHHAQHPERVAQIAADQQQIERRLAERYLTI